jgi:DNA-binding NarL/FixJ family response regulator
MVISREVDALTLWQTLKIGGHGFGIYGGEDLTSFLAAVQAIRRGQTAVCARCLPLLVNAFVRLVPDADARNLTPRQQEVLELLACGLQAKEIARHLHIALPTVRKHLTHILQKYDVASSREAVMRYTRSLHGSQAGLQYLRRATPPLPDVATEPAPRERALRPEDVQGVTSVRARITTPS